MKKSTTIKAITAIVIVTAMTISSSCNSRNNSMDHSTVDSLRNQIMEMTKNDETVAQSLSKMDTLDFVVFSNQQWDRLKESHSKDIKAYWPDGHVTIGLERHVEDLKAMFIYAPDTRCKQHPIRFGAGNMTAVTGVMEGTFTRPMPIGNGKFIQPTGKSFSLPICTIGIWGADGTMTEEHLFWDNQAYMNQIGLGK